MSKHTLLRLESSRDGLDRRSGEEGGGGRQCYQKCPNFGFSPNSDLCTEIVLIWYDLSYQDEHGDYGLALTLGISQKALTVKEKMQF